MNFDLSEQQVMLGDSVRRFVQDHYDMEKRRDYLMRPTDLSAKQARSLLLCAVLTPTTERQAWRRSTRAAKAFIADAAMHLAEECVQFHGGMGITDELIVGHGMKRLMVLSRLFGDGASARNAFASLAP